MPKMANRVQETTTTGGTGTLTLAGAVTGYLTFASSFTTGNSLFYTIDNGVGEWEIGIGTLVTTGTLSRDTVIASSNSNALVNFSSGTKRVFCSAPTRSLVPDQDSKSGYVLTTDGTDPSWTQTLNSITIGNTTPASGAFTTLSASSTVSGSGFSTYLASPPAIGGSSPAAGNFTNLGYTGTLTGGTGVIAIGTNQIYKDSSGNVGIGTSSPGTKLTVNGVASIRAGNGLYLYNAANDGLGIWYNPGGAGVNQLTARVSGSDVLTIDASGNFGLGVTPSAWQSVSRSLDMYGGGSLYSNNSSNDVRLSLNTYVSSSGADTYKTTNFATIYKQISGQHIWQTALSGAAGDPITFTSAMTLDASGNLLVGTTSLDTSGIPGIGLQSDGQIFAGASSQAVCTLTRQTDDGDIAVFRRGTTVVGSIGSKDGDLAIGTGTIGVRFLDGSSAITPQNNSTNSGTDGLLDIGVGAARFRNLYLSGGVYLGGTGSANYLDDYEEGTWTPAFSTTATNFSSVTYNTQNTRGTYTKIGDTVFFRGLILTTAVTVGSASGQVVISGLPFTSQLVSERPPVALAEQGRYGAWITTPSTASVQAGATKFSLLKLSTLGGAEANLVPADLDTGSGKNFVMFSGQYKIA